MVAVKIRDTAGLASRAHLLFMRQSETKTFAPSIKCTIHRCYFNTCPSTADPGSSLRGLFRGRSICECGSLSHSAAPKSPITPWLNSSPQPYSTLYDARFSTPAAGSTVHAFGAGSDPSGGNGAATISGLCAGDGGLVGTRSAGGGGDGRRASASYAHEKSSFASSCCPLASSPESPGAGARIFSNLIDPLSIASCTSLF